MQAATIQTLKYWHVPDQAASPRSRAAGGVRECYCFMFLLGLEACQLFFMSFGATGWLAVR